MENPVGQQEAKRRRLIIILTHTERIQRERVDEFPRSNFIPP